MCFFFFKQKTAYEMRISDWSSDVCSSDIPSGAALSAVHLSRGPNALLMSLGSVATLASISASASGSAIGHVRPIVLRDGAVPLIGPAAATAAATASRLPVARSEEHTSELQSLMRISYAVFCLKKKK